MPNSKESKVRTEVYHPIVASPDRLTRRSRYLSNASQASLDEHDRIYNQSKIFHQPRTEPSRSPDISPINPRPKLIGNSFSTPENCEKSLRAHEIEYPYSILDLHPHTLFAIEPWLESILVAERNKLQQPEERRRMGRSGRFRRRAERKREEAAKEAARLAAEASASKISLESNTSSSMDSYVWSAVRDQRAQADANTSNVLDQSGSWKDSYVWSGQRDAMAAQAGSGSGNGSGTVASLRKRPPVMNLHNASIHSLSSAVSSQAAPAQPAIPERARAPSGDAPARAEPVLTPTSTVPERARAPNGMASAKPPASATSAIAPPVKLTADALAKVAKKVPDIPMPKNGPHIWNAGHDKDPEEYHPTIVRSEKPSAERLCIDAIEKAIRQGERKVDARLVKKVLDHYQDRVEELEIMAVGNRNEVGASMKAMKQKVEMLEKESSRCRTLVNDKARTEGWSHQIDKVLEVVDVIQLREEAETLREENEEVKQNYAKLEGDHELELNLREADQEMIHYLEDEGKMNKEKITQLEEELTRAKKEIALAGFQSRPKVQNRMNRGEISRSESYESTEDSDDSTLNGSHHDSQLSNVSNASTDTTVSTANANIHLLEMSIAHSKKKFTEASRAAAKAEKYLSCLDAKTQLAVKAWHASNVALSDSEDNDNLNLAKRLFEDALFIAQGMKNDKGGKAHEEKCKAWLSHLADMVAKRSASAASSMETSQERPDAGKDNKGFAQYAENKCASQRQDMLWVKRQAQRKAAETASPALAALPIKPQRIAQQLEGMHFYSPSNSTGSNRSTSQEPRLPVLPPPPLGAQLDAASERSFSSPPSFPLDLAPPSSPSVRKRSSQEWPTKLSRSLADELSGLNSSSAFPSSSFRSLVNGQSDRFRSRSESRDSRDNETVWDTTSLAEIRL